jgi:plastocyanin
VRRGAIVAALVASVLAAPATASPLRDTAVGVGEREFTLTPYRRSVPRGIVRFNVTNYGEDTHDLTVLDAKGRTVAQSPEIRADARFVLRARLKRPGVYRLVCTIADHAARGMRARIRIVSK